MHIYIYICNYIIYVCFLHIVHTYIPAYTNLHTHTLAYIHYIKYTTLRCTTIHFMRVECVSQCESMRAFCFLPSLIRTLVYDALNLCSLREARLAAGLGNKVRCRDALGQGRPKLFLGGPIEFWTSGA